MSKQSKSETGTAHAVKVRRSIVNSVITAILGSFFKLLDFEYSFSPASRTKPGSARAGKPNVKVLWRSTVANGKLLQSRVLVNSRGGNVQAYLDIIIPLLCTKIERLLTAGSPTDEKPEPKMPGGEIEEDVIKRWKINVGTWLSEHPEDAKELTEALDFIFLNERKKKSGSFSVTYSVADRDTAKKADCLYSVRIAGTDRTAWTYACKMFLADVPDSRFVYVFGAKGEKVSTVKSPKEAAA